MNRLVVTAFALSVSATLVGACGKSTKEQPSTAGESKVTESGAPQTAPGGTPEAARKAPTRAPDRGPERAVYSLVDNRLAAHLTRGGGLLVNGGSAGMAKYMRFGNQMPKDAKKAWNLRQAEGDVKVARMTGKTGSVFVPLTAAQAGRGAVRARIFAPADGALSLRVNENKDINASFTAGWNTIELTVPSGQLKEGENQLAFFTKPAEVALAWMQIGGATPIGDDGQVGFYDPGKKALVVPKDSAMSWYVMVPDKAKLTADLADGSCTMNVLATAEDGATADGKLAGLGSAVDLGALAGKAVRLDLEATGCAKAELANAALVVPGTAPAVKRGEPPKNIVFIIMDSLRADHVRPFNAKARAETPNWDKLAESSAVFLQNYVQGNESQVSQASMWTSMWLAKHKSPNMKDILPDRYVTIDEVAKKAGKYVAGVSANGYIRPKRGYGSSWDKYVNHIESSMGLKGADILEKGISFITPKKDQPWFLYMGTIDTHVTLRPKEPWMTKYDGKYDGKYKTFGDDGAGGLPKNLSDRDMDHVRALYDSNVSYQDDLLGQLMKTLETWGVLDQTMIIITADHGDELWEDGRFGHGASLRDTLQHVPLLIHYPPMLPAGKWASGTDGIDIVPTLADALGVAIDPEWQGQSLIPLANGQHVYPHLSFGSKFENGHGGRIAHWKGILASAGTPKVYDLAKDKQELKDVYGAAHIGTRLVLDPMWTLRQWAVEWKKSQWGNAANVSSRFAADLGE